MMTGRTFIMIANNSHRARSSNSVTCTTNYPHQPGIHQARETNQRIGNISCIILIHIFYLSIGPYVSIPFSFILPNFTQSISISYWFRLCFYFVTEFRLQLLGMSAKRFGQAQKILVVKGEGEERLQRNSLSFENKSFY